MSEDPIIKRGNLPKLLGVSSDTIRKERRGPIRRIASNSARSPMTSPTTPLAAR